MKIVTPVLGGTMRKATAEEAALLREYVEGQRPLRLLSCPGISGQRLDRFLKSWYKSSTVSVQVSKRSYQMTLRLRFLLVAVVGLVFAGLAPNAFAAAKVRVLHSAPDVPAVTVYVNGAAAIPNLAPLQSTDYLDLPEGTYKVAVALAGQPESAAVLRTDLTVQDGKRYTAFATGLLATSTVKLGALEDVWRAPFTRSSVRVWHNSPDAPAVDVLVNGQAVLTNVPYGATSQYLPLPAGTYDVKVNVAGTSTTVFSSPITLARGESYTAVAMGSVTGKGAAFKVQVLKDATSGALLRVLHASPNVPAVTVYVNGQPAIKRVGTLKWTGYLALDAGTYDVAVAAAGQPIEKAILKAKITLADKTRYTALARGLAGAKKNKLELALQQDLAAAPTGKAAVRVWHLSPDAPKVDIWVNGKKTLSGVGYKQASGYLNLAAGTYRIQVAIAGTKTIVLDAKVSVVADRAYSIAALGSAAGKGKKLTAAVLSDA